MEGGTLVGFIFLVFLDGGLLSAVIGCAYSAGDSCGKSREDSMGCSIFCALCLIGAMLGTAALYNSVFHVDKKDYDNLRQRYETLIEMRKSEAKAKKQEQKKAEEKNGVSVTSEL